MIKVNNENDGPLSLNQTFLTRNTCIAEPREARGGGGEPIRGGRTGEK